MSWVPRLGQGECLECRDPEKALTTQCLGFTFNFALLGLQSSQEPAECPRSKWTVQVVSRWVGLLWASCYGEAQDPLSSSPRLSLGQPQCMDLSLSLATNTHTPAHRCTNSPCVHTQSHW